MRRRTAAVLSTIVCASPALAQTFDWTGAKSTLWNDPTAGTVTTQPNWSPSAVPPAPPNDPAADVTIGSSKTVEVNGLFTVGRLSLGSSSMLNIPTGLAIQPGSFTGSGFITNDGTITVLANAAFGNGHTASDVTLTGTGTLTLNGGLLAPNNVGYNGRFVNASNTIQGAGTIGQSFNGAATLSFTNQGLVDANVPYTGSNPLAWSIVDPGSGTTFGVNSGTLRASNAGRLVLGGASLDNTGGTILATGGGSVVSIANDGITNGTLQTATNGAIQTADLGHPTLTSVTIVGRYQVTNHSSTTLKGTIQNFGTIAISSTDSTSSLATDASGATLSGGGIVQMENSANDNRINGNLTNVNNTIQGVGLIDCSSFTNQGIVSANIPYGGTNALTIWNGFTNTGVIQAAAGGRLQFQFSGVINNAGGTIRALNGSTIDIAGNAADIRGGTLSTTGTGTIAGSNVTLRNLTNAGSFTVENSTFLLLDGGITNSGSINLPVAFSAINLAGSTVLSGGGTVNLGSAFIGTTDNAFTLTNNANTIRGTGTIGNNAWNVLNHSLITADVPYVPANDNSLLVRLGRAGSNTSGTLRATNGGRLVLNNGTTESSAGTVVADDHSEVHLADVHFKHGTLSTTGTGVIKVDNYNGTTLDNLTIAGSVLVENQQFSGFLIGSIVNNGTFTIRNSRMAATQGNVTFSGNGAVILDGANATLNGDGSSSKVIINSFPHVIRGSGQLGQSNIEIDNAGTILADSDTTALAVNTSLGLTNGGTIRASGTAGLRIGNAKITNTQNGILSSVNYSTLTINTPLTMQGGVFDATSLISTQAVAVTFAATKNGTGVLAMHGPLTITSGSLSVNAGKVIVDNAGYDVAALTTYAHNGYNNGAWNGNLGLRSSIAAGDAAHVIGLAVADNATLGLTTFGGQPVAANAVLIQNAYYGDTNIDGRVDADDYARTDRGFNKHLNGWANGDFNYDNVIDSLDYQLIDRGFALQGNPLSAGFLAVRESQFGAEYVSQLLATVPEPSVMGLILIPMVCRRRRR